MKNSDLIARIGAGIELMAVLFNLGMSFLWFISFIWVLVGVLWGFVGLVAVVEACIAVFVLIKGYSPVGLAGPLVGLFVSLCNFNFMGGTIELMALGLLVGALVMRGNETAAEAKG